MDPFDLSTAPIGVPDELVAGSFRAWRSEIDIDDVAFSTECEFRLVSAGVDFTVTGSLISTGLWSFSLVSSTLAGKPEGDYQYRLFAVRLSDSERFELASGYSRIFGSTADRRSHARIMVTKIESVLENRADSDVSFYTIKGRQINKMPIQDLIFWLNFYRAEVASEAIAATGERPKSSVKVRFI